MSDGPKRILKRIRKGSYECESFLVVHAPWNNERWDGPRESYRGWQVYRAGSFIEKRVLLDSFPSLRSAYKFVVRQLNG